MNSASLARTDSYSARSSTTFLDRRFNLLLLLVTFAALLPDLQLGRSQFIGYDGYWHIFTATQDRWRWVVSEWKPEGHPPIYYILLRYVAKLGVSRLVYRLPSIVPGVASVYLLGRVARLLFRNAQLALLAALAYGLSIALIELFCDLRSYPLALFFVIAAFWCLVSMLQGKSEQKTVRLFAGWSVLTTLGILTEYYAIFFALACAIVLCYEVPKRRQPGVMFGEPVRRTLAQISLALVLPCLVTVWLYRIQVRRMPQVPNHVAQFYWSKDRPMGAFLWENLRLDLNALVPFRPHSLTSENVAAAVLIAVLLYVAIWGDYRDDRWRVRSSPALLLLILLIELGTLAVLRRYPFGGYERQQSIIFPFVVLSVFSFLDILLEKLRSLRLSSATVALIFIVLAAGFATDWRQYPRINQELATDTYDSFRNRLPKLNAVYIDQFSFVLYYTHTSDWKWKFKDRIDTPERINLYETVSPSGERIFVMRNPGIWNLDLLRPETYQVIANAMKLSHLDAINVFYVKQGGEFTRRDLASEQRRIAELAGQAGISARGGVYDNMQGLLTFALR